MRARSVISTAAVCGAAAVLGSGALASGETGAGDRSATHGAGAKQSENRALFAVLSGRKEVDDQGRRGAGDLNGRGTFSATIDGDQLCFGLTVKNIGDPVAAHIHRGGPRRNGPIVVPLEPHPTTGDPGASGGCVDVSAAIARAILKNPRKYYANVHTAEFGGGAVRGNLFGLTR